MVSEPEKHCISVFSREPERILVRKSLDLMGSNNGQFNSPHGVAISTDNHILIADTDNNRIQMFTMEGEFVRSVGERGDGPLQFNHPAGIAVQDFWSSVYCP